MEEHIKDRREPEVVVSHEPRERSSSSGYQGHTQPSSLTKWIWGLLILLGIVALNFGLWMGLQSGNIPIPKQPESPELKALKEEVLKLRSESGPLKNEIQSLQDGQKALQEQLTVLKNQQTPLAKKMETQGDKTSTSKAIIYKIQKGDTISSIAKKFRVKPEDIRLWNRLPLKTILIPGKKITIYPLENT